MTRRRIIARLLATKPVMTTLRFRKFGFFSIRWDRHHKNHKNPKGISVRAPRPTGFKPTVQKIAANKSKDRRSRFDKNDPITWLGYRPDSTIAQAMGLGESEIVDTRRILKIRGWADYLPSNMEGHDEHSEWSSVSYGKQFSSGMYFEKQQRGSCFVERSALRNMVLDPNNGHIDGLMRYFVERHAPSTDLPCDKVGWHTLMWVVALADKRGKAWR